MEALAPLVIVGIKGSISSYV